MSCKYKRKILSIDGGGIRGIIPAMILADIEKETGKQIFEMFDLIAGTSTGGILALGLTRPNPFPAQELVNFYKDKGGYIFHQEKSLIPEAANTALKFFRETFKFHGDVLKIIDFETIDKPKYFSDNRERVLKEKFGKIRIEKAVKEVLITSYDTQLRLPVFFTSKLSRQNDKAISHRILCKNVMMKDVAMATSAAPTYFPPHKLKLKPEPAEADKEYDYYSLIDGGVFANNPTSMAIIEAIIDYKNTHQKNLQLEDILVVSLGTGSLIRPYEYDQASHWGILNWAAPLFNIVLDGQSESVACQLDRLLPNAESYPKQYYRFQGMLCSPNDDIDKTDDTNIQDLEKLAQEIIDRKKKKEPDRKYSDWDEMCRQLLEENVT